MTKLEAQTAQFKKAVARLADVLEQEKNDYIRDSAIQRFEFCFDLAWKNLKTYLHEKKGLVCSSPKDCFRLAYQQGIIKYDNSWLVLTDRRNQTAHTYNEKLAEEIYQELPAALGSFEELLSSLAKPD